MTARRPPPYFDTVWHEAHELWEDLTRNPVLAAPWRQLFRQVRSPRHVLSELLQNADDADATWARASVTDNEFTFEHDGLDFDEEQFRSLCRFGYSNKRHLHTIGFRGLGFKAGFGVGPRIHLFTHSLAVEFEESRFTEPRWLEQAPDVEGTVIRIPVKDGPARAAVLDEFERWAKSPIPLLFFRNLTRVELQGVELAKTVDAAGPIPASAWVRLTGRSEERVLHLWSDPEEPPSEVMEEVRSERGDEEFDLPPIQIDLVTCGPSAGRVYVVLPTDVHTSLPFHVQAPFLQDPARTGIKDPATSPTNRWLLARCGRLAASALTGWLENRRLTMAERVEAYGLLARPAAQQPAIPGVVAKMVTDAMRADIGRKGAILATDESLQHGDRTLDLPPPLMGVWSDEDTLRLLGQNEAHIACEELKEDQRDRLAAWGLLRRFKPENMLSRLMVMPAPGRPDDDSLIRLWEFLLPFVRPSPWEAKWRSLKIVPAAGRTHLVDADEAHPITATGRDVTDDDIAFLTTYASLVDPRWTTRLAAADDAPTAPAVRDARELLRILKLDRPVGLREIIMAAAQVAAKKGVNRQDCQRLAYLAAKAGVSVSDEFIYFSSDGKCRRGKDGILVHDDPSSSALLPDDWKAAHILHADYHQVSTFIAQPVWFSWARSERSRLLGFPLPVRRPHWLYGLDRLRPFLKERGGDSPRDLPLKTASFDIIDHDFEEELWGHWTTLAVADPHVWSRVVTGIASAWSGLDAERCRVHVSQSGTKHGHSVNVGEPVASWVARIRSLPCVPDDSHHLSMPSTLLRRLPETAFLEGIEPFVDAAFESRCPSELLDLLGVRSQADSVEPIMDRLRSESVTAKPSQPALFELYRALDRLSARLGAEDLERLTGVFRKERLIRGEDGTWQNSSGVFQRNPDGIPGALEVWSEVSNLGLWLRLGVEPVPTSGLVLAWLRSLPVGPRLSEQDARRVKEVLHHLSSAAWDQLKCWLTINRHWLDHSALKYFTDSPSVCDGLFEYIQKATADASMLDSDGLLCGLEPLDKHLVLSPTVRDELANERSPEWLATLGNCIARIAPGQDPPDQIVHDRACGLRLSASRWRECGFLGVSPTIDDAPAGAVKKVRAAWLDGSVFVCGSPPRHHSELVAALQLPFLDRSIKEAVGHCVGRSRDWIEAYFADRWALLPADSIVPAPTQERSVDRPPGASRSSPVDNVTPVVPEPQAPPASAQPREEADTSKPSALRGPAPPTWLAILGGYLRAIGFEQMGGVFRNPDGDAIHMREGLMHATRYDSSGGLTAQYWVAEPSLDEGVEVLAEVWHAMRAEPEISFVVTPTLDGKVSCFRVDALIGRLDEFPSRYRVRLRVE